ncbi:MAG: hypothetical protein LBR14_01660, partial [Clostridiales Family XIII bacterium]|nr:hypothetical protein [Clostridiales Family XIII bacterium]
METIRRQSRKLLAMVLAVAVVFTFIPSVGVGIGSKEAYAEPSYAVPAAADLTARLAALDEAVGGFDWPEGTDPTENIAQLATMEAKYKALVEAYEAVGDQVPDYAWPNGDPGASGQQLE